MAKWKAHDGGDCPAEAGELVEIEVRAGDISQMKSEAVVWKYGTFILELPGTMPADCEVVRWRNVSPHE